MRPDEDREPETAGRLGGRLQTLLGAGRDLAGLFTLHDDAMRRLPADHPVALEIEYALESRRDRDRAPSASVPMWTDLLARAEASAGPDAAVTIAIRDGQLRSRRARGRPEDLDALVDAYRVEQRRRPGGARAALAWALRDRAWFARFRGPDAHREAPGEGALIAAEVRDQPDPVAARTARRIEAEVLLAQSAVAETRPAGAAAGRALAIAEELLRGAGEDDVDDQLPPAQVLLAEGLRQAGRCAEARRVARLAYALHSDLPVFDPARPLLVQARAERGADGYDTACAALHVRRATFPPDSHYVAEARGLVAELRP
ncbi:hypothetical protein ODJ79_02990 [Actinoplanes sp. KI2]|uniref:hypothetical protein n=1 Tax=Actinoplanes sp. KI2 TaxID=2983315 RepID=UPI0021D58FA4|nr:hypothetical protein [Actinoplanes sp. KI2]MCU7722671.1 hypothetical protein [Actinoplanes sp. KI2]